MAPQRPPKSNNLGSQTSHTLSFSVSQSQQPPYVPSSRGQASSQLHYRPFSNPSQPIRTQQQPTRPLFPSGMDSSPSCQGSFKRPHTNSPETMDKIAKFVHSSQTAMSPKPKRKQCDFEQMSTPDLQKLLLHTPERVSTDVQDTFIPPTQISASIPIGECAATTHEVTASIHREGTPQRESPPPSLGDNRYKSLLDLPMPPDWSSDTGEMKEMVTLDKTADPSSSPQ